MDVPQTRYATTSDGLSIAYQQFGSGPDVVWVTGTASHVELFWELPGWAATLRRLSERCTVTWFDKRGTGLSDRVLLSDSLEDRMADILAVMDHAGIESADLIGLSESGAMSALFAATFPDRVRRLVIVASWAHRPDPDGDGPRLFEQHWGQGALLEAIWAQGHPDRELLGRIERAMGTPTSMAALLRANASLDVRPILPLVRTPTLVVHCTDDPIVPVSYGRELASLMPDATLVEVGGSFHGSARREDMDRYGQAIESFLFGTERVVAPSPDRVLATVLFTDIVGSTDRAAQLGDARWAEVLDQHDRICNHAVDRSRGRTIKATGDGVLATFDGPASAIAAGQQMIRELRLIGIDIRAGVHTGEVERRGEDIGGIGVNLAARVMGAAGTGELWTSSTVPGLTIGCDVEFVSQGRRRLKGVPGEWELFLTSPADSSGA